MKILITGSTGFIGKHLVNKLLEEQHQVFCTVNKNKSISHERIETINFEDHTSNEIVNFLKEKEIEGVIHLASLFLSSHKTEDVGILIDTNVKFSSILLDCAAAAKVKWFINTGTFFQHFNNAEYSPVNLYAATKQAFQVISQYYIEIEAIKFITIKLSDTYGSGDTRSKVFNLWNNAANSGEILEMTEGNQVIDITHIDDVISFFIGAATLLNQNSSSINNGSNYAIRSKKRYTLKQLAEIFQSVKNKKINILWGKKPYRLREVMVPWDKGCVIPKWKPSVEIKEGLKKMFENIE